MTESIEEPHSIGSTHIRLARLASTDEERLSHLKAARAVWIEIGRLDLVAGLEAEFAEQ